MSLVEIPKQMLANVWDAITKVSDKADAALSKLGN